MRTLAFSIGPMVSPHEYNAGFRAIDARGLKLHCQMGNAPSKQGMQTVRPPLSLARGSITFSPHASQVTLLYICASSGGIIFRVTTLKSSLSLALRIDSIFLDFLRCTALKTEGDLSPSMY